MLSICVWCGAVVGAQWQLGGGRSHDRVTLEFRATRWNVVVPTHSSLQDLGAALWDLQQQLNPAYAEENGAAVLNAAADAKAPVARRMLALPPSFPEELNSLHKLLSFPEEVALRLSDVEHELFNSVPAVDYLRHCTTDLTWRTPLPPDGLENGVASLIRRFNEVHCHHTISTVAYLLSVPSVI